MSVGLNQQPTNQPTNQTKPSQEKTTKYLKSKKRAF